MKKIIIFIILVLLILPQAPSFALRPTANANTDERIAAASAKGDIFKQATAETTDKIRQFINAIQRDFVVTLRRAQELEYVNRDEEDAELDIVGAEALAFLLSDVLGVSLDKKDRIHLELVPGIYKDKEFLHYWLALVVDGEKVLIIDPTFYQHDKDYLYKIAVLDYDEGIEHLDLVELTKEAIDWFKSTLSEHDAECIKIYDEFQAFLSDPKTAMGTYQNPAAVEEPMRRWAEGYLQKSWSVKAYIQLWNLVTGSQRYAQFDLNGKGHKFADEFSGRGTGFTKFTFFCSCVGTFKRPRVPSSKSVYGEDAFELKGGFITGPSGVRKFVNPFSDSAIFWSMLESSCNGEYYCEEARHNLTLLIEGLLPPGCADILDLMCGRHSLIEVKPGRFVHGIGLVEDSLAENEVLTSHNEAADINTETGIAVDRKFDAVIITLGIPYLRKPLEVLNAVNNLLKPGGKLIILCSTNKYAPHQAVDIWQHPEKYGFCENESPESRAKGQLKLVIDYLKRAGFETETVADRTLYGVTEDLDYFIVTGARADNRVKSMPAQKITPQQQTTAAIAASALRPAAEGNGRGKAIPPLKALIKMLSWHLMGC